MATHAAAASRSAEPYRLPELLQDIRLLDLLELSGTTVQASQALDISQPTVSRRYRLLAQDFGLQRDRLQRQLFRYGSTEALRWLRLGARAHRLAAGHARIGTDPLHQPFLAGLPGLLPTPVRFRSIHTWAALVREGVIDAALVSRLEMQAAGSRLDRSGLQWVELGALPLGLVVPSGLRLDESGLPPVLVPQRSIAPGLHRLLLAEGLRLRAAGNSCNTAEHLVRRALEQELAIPTYAVTACWGNQLEYLPFPRAITTATGVLVPTDTATVRRFTGALELLKEQITQPQLHPEAYPAGLGIKKLVATSQEAAATTRTRPIPMP